MRQVFYFTFQSQVGLDSRLEDFRSQLNRAAQGMFDSPQPAGVQTATQPEKPVGTSTGAQPEKGPGARDLEETSGAHIQQVYMLSIYDVREWTWHLL